MWSAIESVSPLYFHQPRILIIRSSPNYNNMAENPAKFERVIFVYCFVHCIFKRVFYFHLMKGPDSEIFGALQILLSG